jgi:hypothetical protein
MHGQFAPPQTDGFSAQGECANPSAGSGISIYNPDFKLVSPEASMRSFKGNLLADGSLRRSSSYGPQFRWL